MDLKNITRAAIGQGLGMGWGDEAEAWLRSKLDSDSPDYKQNLEKIRGEYGNYAKENPFTSGALEFAGGVVPGVAAMMVPGGQASGAAQLARTGGATMARMAGAGAITGGIAGAGNATDESGGRMQGATSGAVLGGGLGAAIPIAMRGSGAAGAWLKERLTQSEPAVEKRALAKITNALGQSGITPGDISTVMAADAARGIPSVVANVDQGLADLAQAVAQRTGAGARTIEKQLYGQRLDAPERVMEQSRKSLKAVDYYDDLNKLNTEMKDKAGPLYDLAYAHGEVTDPAVLKFLDLPQFQKGAKEAEKLLAAEGREADMSKPTVEVLDHTKRGLDALIEKETDPITGKVTSLGRVYVQKKQEFLKALDIAVPDYELARGVWAGGAELKDAMNKGLKDFKSMPQEKVKELVEKMSDGEKQAFRTGVARGIYSTAMDPSTNFNAAQRVIGGRQMQERLSHLFENKGEFDLFKAALERESQLFNQSNKILGGSSTGKNLQMAKQLGEDPLLGEAIGHAVTGGFGAGLTSMVMGALRKSQMTEKTASKMASMLMSKDPREVAATVKLLEDYQIKASARAPKITAAEAGAVTGTASAIYPSPIPRQEARPASSIDEDIAASPTTHKYDIEADIAADEAAKEKMTR